MLIKGVAGVFAYPCNTILLTNSARSIPILGSLNAFAISSSAVAKAIGPGLSGTIFSASVDRGYLVMTWFMLAAIAVPGFLCTLWIVDQDGPTADAERRAAVALSAQTEDGVDGVVEEEEMALLAAVDTGDGAKRVSIVESLSGTTVTLGDEEEAVQLIDTANLVASNGMALASNTGTASTSGAELVDGGNAQILDRPISPLQTLHPRPVMARKNSAAGTGRSSLDPGFGFGSGSGIAGARLRSPTPSRGLR